MPSNSTPRLPPAASKGSLPSARTASISREKRSSAWLKIKTTQTAEFVVGGYTKGKGGREPLGALLLGYWNGGKLHYAGHVGSGLTSDIIDDLGRRTAQLARSSPPFVEKVPLHRPTKWLEPELSRK